ncbi:MAG TPA: hypothetical protein VF132_07295 [Rudaea sp.]
MIFPYPREFPADAIERRVPDPDTARTLVRERRPDVLALLERRRGRLATSMAHSPDLIERGEDAVLMAFCRIAFRHGTWGEDYHAYHNEAHALEIVDARMDCLIGAVGAATLSPSDWFLLTLFGAAHDLRQREAPEYSAGVGSNERASVEETFRILQACGFTRQRDPELFAAIELMIAGSTFDARPTSPREYNTADVIVQSGGALAQKLDTKLDKYSEGWRDDARVVHALDLALIAADLDTANVAEPFPRFMASSERLCLEREMRSHRDPASRASAQPVLSFLTEGTTRYFFELHRFSSDVGRRTFAQAKEENAAKLRTLTAQLSSRWTERAPPASGTVVLDAFREIAAVIG